MTRRPARPPKNQGIQRFFIGVAGTFLLFAIFGFVFREAIWNRCANFLIAPDTPEKSDVMFLLGGDYLLRAPYAAQLYKEGYAPKILIAREPVHWSENGRVDFTEDTIRLLKKDGVPGSAVVDFSPTNGVRSTADEARALRIYADVYPIRSVLVITSMMHSRRARMAIRRALRGKGIRILVACAGPRTYTPDQSPQAKEEMIKTIYYFFTFWG